jgi:hypothetical protein
LVPRNVWLAAIGDKRGEIVSAKRPQAQTIRNDLDHGTILRR